MNVKFPHINYFQTKKTNLTENLTVFLKQEKEKTRKKLIPKRFFDLPEYTDFIKDTKNPSLGGSYLQNKHKKMFDNFYVNN